VNIKGLQKTSLIDYPETICSVLFFGGCNLRCKYCYNPELACNSKELENITEEDVLSFLKKRKKLISGVTLSGGEPLLNSSIKDFILKIKSFGLKIKLDTNGFYPKLLNNLLNDNLIDYLAIDVKTSPEKYVQLTGVKDLSIEKLKETIEIAKNKGLNFELRTTCIPQYITMQDLQSIKNFTGDVKKYYLQQFINEHTLDKEFLKINPYPKEIIYEFRKYVLTFAKICEIRGL